VGRLHRRIYLHALLVLVVVGVATAAVFALSTRGAFVREMAEGVTRHVASLVAEDIHDPVALARILAEDDVGALCLVPGVGRKTAARLLVELKSRLHIPLVDPRVAAGLGRDPNGNGAPHPPSVRSDVREALAGLGYSADEIHGATAELPDDGDVSQLLRQALKHLATARQG